MWHASEPECVHNPTLDGDVAVPRDTADMFDLVLPLECGGCGAPSTRWCPACAQALAVHPDQPHLITPRVDPGVPVFSLGRYAGRAPRSHRRRQRARPRRPHRAARGRPAGRVGALADMGCHRVAADRRPRANAPIVRQAPRRRPRRPDGAARPRRTCAMSTSRRRCDCGRWSATPSACLAPIGSATSQDGSRSSSRVAGEVLVVDDIVTTGATASESVRVLQTSQAPTWPVCLRSPMPDDGGNFDPRSTPCEELKTGPRIYWHYRVNTDYRRHQPPVNASRRRST